MPWRHFIGHDATAVSPVQPGGTVDLFKLALLAAGGYLWDTIYVQAGWVWHDPTMALVWLFWCLDMVAGVLASMVRGLKPPAACEFHGCPQRPTCGRQSCKVQYPPVKGWKAFSGRLSLLGCAKLLFWSIMVWSCHELRQYVSSVTTLASSTVEVYILVALFCSFFRNLSRLAGDPRGEQAAAQLEDRLDKGLGIHKGGNS